MKSNRSLFIFCLTILVTFEFCNDRKTLFTFTESHQGIKLYEDGQPVFFYQREPKSLDGEYICNNYIHPLYSIDGDILTEEFPPDHHWHRGIFWAWQQIYIDNKNAGSSWLMQNIYHDVFELQTSVQNNTARLNLDVHWKSSVWQSGRPFVHEQISIIVHRLKRGIRKIDFEINLKALVPGVSIGGYDDEKGLSGFSLRIRLPGDLVFTSSNGPEIPQDLQTGTSSWMDFSGSFGTSGEESGLTLICHPNTPNYPPTWILRQSRSMQNVIYPGRKERNCGWINLLF